MKKDFKRLTMSTLNIFYSFVSLIVLLSNSFVPSDSNITSVFVFALSQFIIALDLFIINKKKENKDYHISVQIYALLSPIVSAGICIALLSSHHLPHLPRLIILQIAYWLMVVLFLWNAVVFLRRLIGSILTTNDEDNQPTT